MDAGVDDAQECVGVAFVAAFHVAVILACGKEKFGQRGPLFFAEGHDFVVNVTFGWRVGHAHEPAVKFLILLGEFKVDAGDLLQSFDDVVIVGRSGFKVLPEVFQMGGEQGV